MYVCIFIWAPMVFSIFGIIWPSHVIGHQPLQVLAWWRHQMETFSALLAICAGNSPVPGEFPAQRPVTRSFDVFFDLRLNKRLSKQSWGWWFETLSCPLWRYCNDILQIPVSFQIRLKSRRGSQHPPSQWRHMSVMVKSLATLLLGQHLVQSHNNVNIKHQSTAWSTADPNPKPRYPQESVT